MNVKLVTSFVLFCSPAFAHEFWIEPSKFRPEVGEKVELRLRVGEQFEGQPAPRKNDRIKVFAYFAPHEGAPIAISGPDDADPAGGMEIAKPGLYILGFHNTPSRIELEPEKFEEYLKGDGLDWVIAERKRLGESDKPGRELYSRCAKALLSAGDSDGKGFDRRFDFPLEFIPQSNPSAVKAGDKLDVLLLFNQKPISGVKVSAMRRGAFDKAVSARTDANGVVRLPLDEPGLWLIFAVHMTRAENDADADWQSFWASLTFKQPANSKD